MSNHDDFDVVREAIKDLIARLDNVPAPVRKAVQDNVDTLYTLVHEHRVPRVMLIGRRGSGKSMLINAIFDAEVRMTSSVRAATGEARWEPYERDGRRMEILDTRGVQESSKPLEADTAATPLESLLMAVRRRPPDVILFVVAATDVDVAMQGDLDALVRVQQEVARLSGESPTVIPVLSKCDRLDPNDVPVPTDDPDKLANLAEATETLLRHLKAATGLTALADPVATVANVIYDSATRRPKPGRDYRWNIGHLTTVVFEHLPDEAKLEFARLQTLTEVRRQLALRVVNSTAVVCGGVGLQPIPIVDLPVLTGIQVGMIMVIAYIGGADMSVRTARDLLGALGVNVVAGMAFRQLARSMIKLIPGAGTVAGGAVSGAIAASGTKAIGAAAVSYFIDRNSIEKVRETYRRQEAEPEAE
ncbi:GTPase [Catenuloplanes japonicus]|uniref:GTPase n=1 Tax=Catenuloplanes japonicus TaxID=33876 RepID=UPI000527E56A|nr:GTPase [Catenuloplanes japonicus]